MGARLDKISNNVSWKVSKLDLPVFKPFYSLLDLFGFSPIPRYAQRDQQSMFGAIMSLGVIALMLFYVISTAQRFQDFNPVVTSSLGPVDQSTVLPLGPIALDEPGVDFAVVFRTQPLNSVFNDSRYGSFAFTLVTVNDQDLSPRTRVPITIVPCNFAARYPQVHIGWLGQNAMCPASVVSVSGSYATARYSFLQIDFNSCDPSQYPSDPNYCVSEDERWRLFNSARINFLYVTTDFAHDRYLTPIPRYDTTYYFLKRDVWTLSEIFFRAKTITVLPDLVYRTDTEMRTTHLFDHEKAYINDGNSSFVGRRIQTSFIRLDTTVNTELWNVQTILDLLGSWSAFFGTLTITIGAIALAQNKNYFYLKNRSWDDFDEGFKSRFHNIRASQDINPLDTELRTIDPNTGATISGHSHNRVVSASPVDMALAVENNAKIASASSERRQTALANQS